MKPSYSLFNNTKYALSGLKILWKNEMSFRLEILIILPLIIISLFLPLMWVEHLLLIIVLLGILISESINSSIEACVDLITQDFHPLAKIAKDCASTAVLLSVILAILVWGVILFQWWQSL